MRRVRQLIVILLAAVLPLQESALAAKACVCPANSVAASQTTMANCDTPTDGKYSTSHHGAPVCGSADCVCATALSVVAGVPATGRIWTIEVHEPAIQTASRPFSFDPCPGPWRPPRAC